MFDIISFYNDHQVDYSLSGNNVMEGWVNINCPFCDDKSNHLGVYIKKPRRVMCWRCGEHTIPELLAHFSDQNIKRLYEIYKTDGEEEEVVQTKKQKPQLPLNDVVKLFEENSKKDICSYGKYSKYLLTRDFSPFDIHRLWGVCDGIEMGKYRYRLMIPIYKDGVVVSFQGRDITGKQSPKYLNCHGTNIKDYLYGIDYIYGDRVVIVEGVTDVWRFGRGNAVATLGIEYSTKQLVTLIKRGIKHAIVFFDSEPQALSASTSLKGELELLDINCEQITLPQKDPADLNNKEVKGVLKQLLNM